jgi:hypothetical protein
MTQEERELLRKDLCARLHYGVKVHLSRKHNRHEEDTVLNNVIITKDGLVVSNIIGYNYFLSEIKPYLRPMSSMTEEEKKIYSNFFISKEIDNFDFDIPNYDTIDWLNAHHFDYRGLIEKGLALEAKDGMYNIKKK